MSLVVSRWFLLLSLQSRLVFQEGLLPLPPLPLSTACHRCSKLNSIHRWSLKVITSRTHQWPIFEVRRDAAIARAIINPPAPRLNVNSLPWFKTIRSFLATISPTKIPLPSRWATQTNPSSNSRKSPRLKSGPYLPEVDALCLPQPTGSLRPLPQWDSIRKRSFGLFLVTDCGGIAVSPRRFHTPIPSLPHSRESPSIGSSLTFEGHISQSCGADIHSVHSFLTGTRRLILSAAAWGIHTSMHGDRRVYSVPRFQPRIDPFIGHPSRNGKCPSIEAAAFVHRFIGTLQPSWP